MRSSRRPLRRARPCRTPRLAAFVAVAVAVVAAAVALAPPPARAGDGETFVLITTNQGGVLRFGLDGAPQGVFAPPGGPIALPQGIALGPDGRIYVTNFGGGVELFEPDGTHVRRIDSGAEMVQPTWAGFRDGILVVSSAGNHRLLRYDLANGDRLLDDLVTGQDAAALNRPQTVRWSPDGTFVVSNLDDRILRFAADGTALGDAAAGTPLARPLGMLYREDGSELLVANYDGGPVWIWDVEPDGTLTPDRALNATQAGQRSDGIARLPGGNLLVAYFGSNRIVEYLPDGTFVQVFADAAKGIGGPNQILVVPPRGGGEIRVRFDEPALVRWEDEPAGGPWNLYRGALAHLAASGVYTQEPGSHPLAGRLCGLVEPAGDAGPDPDPGDASFLLVAAAATATSAEGGLGSDGAGAPRPNATPCPQALDPWSR